MVRLALTVLLAPLAWPSDALAADWGLEDRDLLWPLCGRIAEDPPDGWEEDDGCPVERAGDAAHADYPMMSNFGPRVRSRSGGRYDFHRGIDMSTDCGTPIFAVADGVVVRAGKDSAFDDQVVQVEHANGEDCEGGCFYSTYMHLSGATVEEDDVVTQGQHLGWTGYSDIGDDDRVSWEENCAQERDEVDHLHFDIREAPLWDVDSSWSRFATNPLRYLPYDDADDTIVTTIERVDTRTPGNPVVTVSATQENGEELDHERMEVWVYEVVDGERVAIEQPGNTRNADGYLQEPSFFDNTVWNDNFTHTDSSAADWESYADCPLADEHGDSYRSAIHMDNQSEDDESVGSLSGVDIAPEDFSVRAESFVITYTFNALIGPEDADDLCIVAAATDATGNLQPAAEWGCPEPADDTDAPGEGPQDCGCRSLAPTTLLWPLAGLLLAGTRARRCPLQDGRAGAR